MNSSVIIVKMPTGGIKIVCEANLSSLTSDSGQSSEQLISEGSPVQFLTGDGVGYQDIMAKRTFVNLDSATWAGGVATVVTPTSTQTAAFTEFRQEKQDTYGRSPGNTVNGRRVKEEECLLDPEEEEKRRIRRERNKLAAARCRKRRVDQIETLQKDVEDWEERKRLLQEEIARLQQQREEFTFILEAHKSVCKQLHQSSTSNSNNTHFSSDEVGPRVVTVKSEPEIDTSYTCNMLSSDCMENFPLTSMSSISVTPVKVQRPVSLSLKSIPLRSIEGVSIDTPTTCLNFDSLMDGRTGLTPTNILTPININVSAASTSLNTPAAVPSCGTQQRHQGISITASMSELSSPSNNSPNLVSL